MCKYWRWMVDLQGFYLYLQWKIKTEKCKGSSALNSCSETLKICMVAYSCCEETPSPVNHKFKQMAFEETCTAPVKVWDKICAGGLGRESALLLLQTKASSHGHQQCLEWRNPAELAKWLASGRTVVYRGWGVVGYLCAGDPCAANVIRAIQMLSGPAAVRNSCTARLIPSVLGSRQLGALLYSQDTWQRADKRAVHRPTAASFLLYGGFPPVKETRNAARSLCNLRLLHPSPAAATLAPGRDPAAGGLRQRVPRTLNPNGSVRGRSWPGNQGCGRLGGQIARSPAQTTSIPSGGARAGAASRALGSASPPLAFLLASGLLRRGVNSRRRDVSERPACPQPLLPSCASSSGHWDWWINHDVAAVNAFMWSGLCHRLEA